MSNVALKKASMASISQNPIYTRGTPKRSRDRAREQLMQSIKINKPEVLASLSEDVLPVYRSLYEIVPSTMNQTETEALARKLFPSIRSKRRMELVNRLIRSIQDKMMFWAPVLESDPRDGEYEYNVKLSLDDPDNRVGLEDYAYGFVYDFQDVSIERKSKRTPDGFDPSRLDLVYDLGERIYKVYLKLYQWSLHWSISDKWFLEQGLQTLNLWCREEMTNNWNWAYIPEFLMVLSPDYFNFHFRYMQRYPEADSWPLYKKRARNRFLAEFEKAIDSYRKQREQAIGKQKRARDKRSAFFMAHRFPNKWAGNIGDYR